MHDHTLSSPSALRRLLPWLLALAALLLGAWLLQEVLANGRIAPACARRCATA